MEVKMQHRSRVHVFQIQVKALIKTLKCLQSDDKYQALLFLISAIKLYVKILYTDCQERIYKPSILRELHNIENVIVVNLLKSRSAAASGSSSVATGHSTNSSSFAAGGKASCLDISSTSVRSADLSIGGDGLLLLMRQQQQNSSAPLAPWDLRGKLLRGNLFDGLSLTTTGGARGASGLLPTGAGRQKWLGNVRMNRALVRLIASHDFKLLFNMFEQSIFPTWKIYKNEQIFVRKRPALTTVTVRTSLPALCYEGGLSHSPPATYIKKEEFDFDPPYSMADDHCFEEIKEEDEDLLLMKEEDSIDNSNEIFSEEESSTNNTSLMLSSDTNTLDTNDSSMVSHERNKEQVYQCLLCDKSYRKRKSLVIHFSHHPGFCPDCGKQRGVTSEEIVEHNRMYHKNRPHICEHCGETFTRNQQYQIHVEGHFISKARVAEQNCKKTHKYSCKTCSIVFNNQKYLEKHIQKTNHQAEGLVCDICGAIFCNSIKLSQHVTRSHNNVFTQKTSLEQSLLLQGTSVAEKNYPCDQCGASFLSQPSLREHIKIAHPVPENKFECNICNKVFAAKRSLKRHKLCHSNERAFHCTVENCKETYKNQSHLARHMKAAHQIDPPSKRLQKAKAVAAALATSSTSAPEPLTSGDLFGGHTADAQMGGSCDSIKATSTLKKSLGSSEKSLGDSSTNFSDNMSAFNYEFSDTTGGTSTPAIPTLEQNMLPSTGIMGSGPGAGASIASSRTAALTCTVPGQGGAFNDPTISFSNSGNSGNKQQVSQQQQQHIGWQNLDFSSGTHRPGIPTGAGAGGMPPMDPLAIGPGSFMDGTAHHQQSPHHQHHHPHHQQLHHGGNAMTGAPSATSGFMVSSGPRRFPLPESNFICEHCDETNFINAQQFQLHIQDHFAGKEGKEHANKKLQRLNCKTCSLVFATGAQLDRHIQKTNHHTECIACEICSAIFNSNLKVYQHMLKCHKNDVWFACEQCSKVFIMKQDYDKHQLVHQTVTDRSIICEHCASSFLTQEALKEHIKIAHSMDKKYKCPICNKLFAARRSLKRHKLCHEEEAAFRCSAEGCSEAFRTAGNLAKHKKMAHPAGLAPAAASVAASIDPIGDKMVVGGAMGQGTSKLPSGLATPMAGAVGAGVGVIGGPNASPVATNVGAMKTLEKSHPEMMARSGTGSGMMSPVGPGGSGNVGMMGLAGPSGGMMTSALGTGGQGLKGERSSAGNMMVPPSRTSSAGSNAGGMSGNNPSVSNTTMLYNPYEAMHYNSSVLGPPGPQHHPRYPQPTHSLHHSPSQFGAMTNPGAVATATSMHYGSPGHGLRTVSSGTGPGTNTEQQQAVSGYRITDPSANAASVGAGGSVANTGTSVPYNYGQVNNQFDWQNMELGGQMGVETDLMSGGTVSGGNGSVTSASMKSSKYYQSIHEASAGGPTSGFASTGLLHQHGNSTSHASAWLQQQQQLPQGHPHQTQQASGLQQSKTSQEQTHQQQQQQHLINMNNQDMMGYQEMWNANMMKMEFQEETSGSTAAASGSYNSLGTILTNLELMGSGSSFEQQSPQQQQQQQSYDMLAGGSRTATDQARLQSAQSPVLTPQQVHHHSQQQQQQLHQQSKGNHFHGANKQQHSNAMLPIVEPGQLVGQHHHQQQQQQLHHQQQQYFQDHHGHPSSSHHQQQQQQQTPHSHHSAMGHVPLGHHHSHHSQQQQQHHLQQQQMQHYNPHMPQHPQLSQHHPHAPGPPQAPSGQQSHLAQHNPQQQQPQHQQHPVAGLQQQPAMSYNPNQSQAATGDAGGSNTAAPMPTDISKTPNNLPFVDSFTESIDYLQQSFQYV